MVRYILCLFILACGVHVTSAQNFCPPNIDFERGDFTGWKCAIGSTSVNDSLNIISLTPSPPTPGRHEIISDTTQRKDYYGNFPIRCPYGGKYSVKLGNMNTGAEAEGISYTFKVPSFVDTFSFTYFYAVVFEDPGHDPWEQPRFFVTAYDSATGALINCASYNYISSGSIPGFKHSANDFGVLYKDWSPVTIQFAGLANRTVVLEFKTADCTIGGHFGYAYLDVGSACSNVLATAPYCVETNSLILNAPYGFQSYTWYNSNYTAVIGTQQSVTLSPPPANNTIFYVDLVPYPGYGCRDTAYATVTPLPVPDTPQCPSPIGYCQYDAPAPLVATGANGNEIWWYSSATGGIGSQTPPIPSTATAGTFDY